MKTKHTILIVGGILIIILAAILFFYPSAKIKAPTGTAFDPLNATYNIGGQNVTLVDGSSEIEATPGSASKIKTMVFGVPTSADLNGDGLLDAALMLVQDSGGSGTFYYAAAAINTPSGAVGTNAVLLGDRIAPQNIEVQNGQIIANFADRLPGQPMTVSPSLGVSKYFVVSGNELVGSAPVAAPGEHCGGNKANAPTCQSGYHCAPAPGSNLPFGDVGGVCVQD